jgi:hypothetical protein
MTEDMGQFIESISINQILVAILEEHKKITVPTLNFLNVSKSDKELVIDYDENVPSFTFSLREKIEQQ